MAKQRPDGVPIPQGIIDMISGAVSSVGQALDGWFGPGRVVPAAPPVPVDPRRFDYPIGYNLNRGQRNDRDSGSITFTELRNLADFCSLLRLIIETRKDQLSKLRWMFRVKAKPGEPAKSIAERTNKDPRVIELTRFFESPDQEHDWPSWFRMLMEEALVIDAACLYAWPRNDRALGPYALEVIDGSTIKRVIDARGRTPRGPEEIAYQQIIKGLPAVDFTWDELLYSPRNPRPNRIYGYSPVEQIIVYVNMALRRALFQLNHYTEGNMPVALLRAPDSWTAEMIALFQEHFDGMLKGNQAARSRGIWIPNGAQPVFPQEGVLKDEFDEFLARLIAYAFSVSPNFFIKTQNRASSGNYWDEADAQGMEPWKLYGKSLIDQALVRWWKITDLEFAWEQEREEDGEKQSKIDVAYVGAGIKTANEIREEQGLEALEGGDELRAAQPPPPADGSGDPATSGGRAPGDSQRGAPGEDVVNAAKAVKKKSESALTRPDPRYRLAPLNSPRRSRES